MLGSLGSQTQGEGHANQQEDTHAIVRVHNNSGETQAVVTTTETIISVPEHASISVLA
jgi:hypothetical protein